MVSWGLVRRWTTWDQLVRERVHFPKLHRHTKPPRGQAYNHRQLYLNHLMCNALHFSVHHVCWERLWIKKMYDQIISVHKLHIFVIVSNTFSVCTFSENRYLKGNSEKGTLCSRTLDDGRLGKCCSSLFKNKSLQWIHDHSKVFPHMWNLGAFQVSVSNMVNWRNWLCWKVDVRVGGVFLSCITGPLLLSPEAWSCRFLRDKKSSSCLFAVLPSQIALSPETLSRLFQTVPITIQILSKLSTDRKSSTPV